MSKDSVVINTDESLTFEPLWFCVDVMSVIELPFSL